MLAIHIIVLFVWLTKLFNVEASNEVFNQCIRSNPNPGVIKCIGQQTLSSLHNIDKLDNYTITEGLEIIRRDDGMQRTFSDFFTDDPMDFRGMLENAGTLVSQRSLQWDLSSIQSGLCMRIGPTGESTSMLEFVIDPHLDRGDRYLIDDTSTARILTKQFVVPLLLGLKLNLVIILPLIFAGIIFLLKKAAFLGKIAIFLSGLLGFSGLFSIGQFGGINNSHHQFHHHHRPPIFGSGAGGGVAFGDHHDTLSGGYYKSGNIYEFATTEKEPDFVDTFYNYEKKLVQNKSDKLIYDKEPKTTTDHSPRANSYRSFVWKTA